MRELEALERGEFDRLMVFMPPGGAKSTYTSIYFPPWYMGRNPDKTILGVSNTTELAERFSRRVRNTVATPAYNNVFNLSVAADSAAAGRWETSTGAEYFAAGMGTSIAGRRADLGLIDDPIKKREEADSETIRQKHWDWYLNDFLTRLKPNARQILIQTRWHEDDLGGRILEREAHKWRIIKVPMIAGLNDPLQRQPGERLWPEWFTNDMVETAKMDTRSWNALYQQEPVPDTGDIFQKEFFNDYTTPPQLAHIYGASDFAVTADGGDYTEHGVFGVDWNNDVYVLDWWYGQTSPEEWIERQCDLILQYKPMCWFGESGVIRRAIEPTLKRRMEERRAYCRLEWMPSISDKVARARPIQARAAMGKVLFPKHASWKEHVFTQLMKFPTGKHDDAVDVLSLIGRGLEFIKTPTQKKTQTTHQPIHPGGGGWMA